MAKLKNTAKLKKNLGPGHSEHLYPLFAKIIADQHPGLEQFQNQAKNRINELNQQYELYAKQQITEEEKSQLNNQISTLAKQNCSLQDNLKAVRQDNIIYQNQSQQLQNQIQNVDNQIAIEQSFIQEIGNLLIQYDEDALVQGDMLTNLAPEASNDVSDFVNNLGNINF
jgi:multidrug efflux pump subunit AcrA (membrane-fusion protein)